MLFVVADARNMPFKDNVFQSVTAWGGTTEIENAEAGLTETFRVLERNG
jgi:ubiquinone/menaquinone biosynthesis C-methylase UbiE